MFKRITAAAVLSVFLAFSLAGCASETYQEHKGAAVGGVGGAAAGGILGGLVGGKTGAVVGVLVGGLAGAAIGNYTYDQKRTEQEAKSQYGYNYNKAGGNMVRIENSSVVPDKVTAGGTVSLVTNYTVLGQEGATSSVTETREIWHEGQHQGNPSVTVQRAGGTYESKVPLTLPSNAPKGVYVVKTTISSGSSSDTKETSFTVE
jgi:phage tail tape-measure protein